MCQNCENCLKIRFIKPEEDNRSFCVTLERAAEIEKSVAKFSTLTTTHREKTQKRDHPNDFEAKQT